MAHTNIHAVRTLIGDRDKFAYDEVLGTGTGLGNIWQLDMFPVRTGTVDLFRSGVVIGSATGNPAIGTVDYSGVSGAITAGAIIKANYQYNALSDDEISGFIDLASGDGVLKAGAIAARALAGDASRFFSYKQGSKSIDKSKISKNLLAVADSLEKSLEKSQAGAGLTVTVGTYDDSGTPFEGFDTGVAEGVTSTA